MSAKVAPLPEGVDTESDEPSKTAKKSKVSAFLQPYGAKEHLSLKARKTKMQEHIPPSSAYP